MQMMHFLIKNVLIHIYFKNSNLTVGLNQIQNSCSILSTHLLLSLQQFRKKSIFSMFLEIK